MIRYLARRAGNTLLQMLGLSILLFLLSKAVPGEFLSDARLNAQISPETIAALRAQYGLDQPLPVRYVRWLGSVAKGDLGYSFAYNMPVSSLLWPRARHTLLLTVPALLLAWLIALPLGTLAAARRGTWVDRLFSTGTSALLAAPDLFLALVIMLFALRTGLFPVGGMASLAAQEQGGWRLVGDTVWHMILPVTALVMSALPALLRHVRAGMVAALDSSSLRAARGHGLPPLRLLFGYALPAAANPLISLFGLSIAGLLSISLLVEVVMSWPGMGPLVLEAIMGRDLFVVIGAAMLSMVFLAAGNLLADVLLYACDPRIRVE